MTTPYYSDDAVTLYHGDCLDILPELHDVDLVVTSPPYNLGTVHNGVWGHYKPGQSRGGAGKSTQVKAGGIGYDEHDDALPHDTYVDWQRKVLSACWDSLSDRGAIFYNHKPRIQRAGLLTPLELNPGLPLRQIIIWARSGGINSTRTAYMPTHEWILVMAKDEFRLRDQSASGVGDVWRIHQANKDLHPAPFPVELPARVIETTAPNLVVDPFCGSGTTLLAARDAGVRSVGIEVSERYCEIAATRLTAERQMILDGTR